MTTSPHTACIHHYELTNHLGNVSVIVSDKKLLSANRSQKLYLPEVISYQDYYPFGMLMTDRSGSLPDVEYRYGYNGKENDNEVKGESNQQDYGFRVYDPRVGRFLSVDPLTKDFAMLTPYQFASNMPIAAIDIDGLESKLVVYELGANSTFSYTVDLTDPNLNPKNVLYANQAKYGTRGTLTVIKKNDSDDMIRIFEINKFDWLANQWDNLTDDNYPGGTQGSGQPNQ